ncbi:MAG: hypothetical protein Nk1A_7810 [Endomicrobiia bacterium]|nr:MAG: hypothetical protein Nk1A_7810 [Endomicrobiia bacterium]
MFEVDPSSIDYDIVAPFLIFSGFTSSENVKHLNTNSKYIVTDDPEGRDVRNGILQKLIDDHVSWGDGLRGKKIVSGTIYIPMTEDIISVYSKSKMAMVPKSHGYVDNILSNVIAAKNKQALGPTTDNDLQ